MVKYIYCVHCGGTCYTIFTAYTIGKILSWADIKDT